MKIKLLSFSLLVILAVFVMAFQNSTEASSSNIRNMSEKPPIGKYVCRQYMTTMGYLTLKNADTYEVSKVPGKYVFDSSTKEVVWKTGKYKEWDWKGVYEVIPAEGERPEQYVIRITSEKDKLKINCYYMAEQD